MQQRCMRIRVNLAAKAVDVHFDQVREWIECFIPHVLGNCGRRISLTTKEYALLEFLLSAKRGNLRINFDPANMILYGTGDPITALDTLGQYVTTVHCKDGDWPPRAIAGALGTEQPLGQGSVGMERFIAKLKDIGYKGPLTIEREASDPVQRRRDILKAAELLRGLGGRTSDGERL